MKNKSKYQIIIIGLVILIALIIALTTLDNKDTDSFGNIDDAGTNLTNEPAGVVTEIKTPIQDVNAPIPPDPDYVPEVYTKEIDLEIMTAEEKTALGINAAEKIQVLSRNENGKVTAYKIIQTEEDVVEFYGN